MRVWLLPVAALFAFGTGCNKSPEGGTPNSPSNFTFSLPVGTKDVKQGTAETYEASIERGAEFKKDVKLSVNKLDKVEVKLSKDVIKASEDGKFTITVTADKEAALAEHPIQVTGTPEGGGAATTGEFKVKVKENK